MADILVVGTPDPWTDLMTGLWGPYWISTTVGLIVYLDETNNTAAFRRTDDGGATWDASSTTIYTTDVRKIACWFDQETPGDSGTLVHVVIMDSNTGDVSYIPVDISDGSVGSIIDVDDSNTISVSGDELRSAISKARNGDLMVAYSTQSEIACYTSDDNGATWDVKTDVYETANQEDYCLLYPANVDDGDFAAIFWDRSANEISVKMFDTSAGGGSGTWTETTIVSATDNVAYINMDGAVRHSDGFIVGAAHNAGDSAGDDLIVFTVDPDSIAAPAVLVSPGDFANIFTDQGESMQCAVMINQQNDDIYVAYLKGGTWLSDVAVVYHISTNGMTSWGTEQAYSEAADDDFRRVHAGRTVGDNGGFFQPAFFDDDDSDIFVNVTNDVAIAAAAAGGRIMSSLAAHGGLAGHGGIAGIGGGLAG